jgi:hypothetical protein
MNTNISNGFNPLKNPLIVSIILCAMSLFMTTMLTLELEGEKQKVIDLRSKAISLNFAEYNSTNGVWQWKTNSP